LGIVELDRVAKFVGEIEMKTLDLEVKRGFPPRNQIQKEFDKLLQQGLSIHDAIQALEQALNLVYVSVDERGLFESYGHQKRLHVKMAASLLKPQLLAKYPNEKAKIDRFMRDATQYVGEYATPEQIMNDFVAYCDDIGKPIGTKVRALGEEHKAACHCGGVCDECQNKGIMNLRVKPGDRVSTAIEVVDHKARIHPIGEMATVKEVGATGNVITLTFNNGGEMEVWPEDIRKKSLVGTKRYNPKFVVMAEYVTDPKGTEKIVGTYNTPEQAEAARRKLESYGEFTKVWVEEKRLKKNLTLETNVYEKGVVDGGVSYTTGSNPPSSSTRREAAKSEGYTGKAAEDYSKGFMVGWQQEWQRQRLKGKTMNMKSKVYREDGQWWAREGNRVHGPFASEQAANGCQHTYTPGYVKSKDIDFASLVRVKQMGFDPIQMTQAEFVAKAIHYAPDVKSLDETKLKNAHTFIINRELEAGKVISEKVLGEYGGKAKSTSKKQQKLIDSQKRKLAWVLHEYDCQSLEEAKEKAKQDMTLHRLLRECGVVFN
jgi:hypothetical protein